MRSSARDVVEITTRLHAGVSQFVTGDPARAAIQTGTSSCTKPPCSPRPAGWSRCFWLRSCLVVRPRAANRSTSPDCRSHRATGAQARGPWVATVRRPPRKRAPADSTAAAGPACRTRMSLRAGSAATSPARPPAEGKPPATAFAAGHVVPPASACAWGPAVRSRRPAATARPGRTPATAGVSIRRIPPLAAAAASGARWIPTGRRAAPPAAAR